MTTATRTVHRLYLAKPEGNAPLAWRATDLTFPTPEAMQRWAEAHVTRGWVASSKPEEA